jgi:ABC-2 type transport system permease protein
MPIGARESVAAGRFETTRPAASRLDCPEALWHLRARLLRHTALAWLRESRLRLLLVAAFGTVFWLLLFALFFEAFYFLHHRVRVGSEITGYLFGTFFMSLSLMLTFSAGIISYHGLFRSSDLQWLLATPLSDARVFNYKFQEALFLSSWGFLLLSSPMMVAYGLNTMAPLLFYLVFPVTLVLYVWIPGALGTIGALLVVLWMPRRAAQFGLVLIGALVVVAAVWTYRLVTSVPGTALSPEWLDALLARLRFSQQPMLPNFWVSELLLAASRGDRATCLFFLLVLLANAAMAHLVAVALAQRWYRVAYSRCQSAQARPIRLRLRWVARFVHGCFRFIDLHARVLFLKDLRTFFRDPAQWSQLLIFFGLLALYFLNVKWLRYDERAAYWRNMVSFLNLTATALILATFTSRFVFPLVSLEGRKFWLLGLLPIERETILWGKFAYSVLLSLVATEALVILSDLVLRLELWLVGLHAFIMFLLCLGLSGISVGLGARWPNLRTDDPSRIAAGFGGTLNLVVSMAFILGIVFLTAVPCHLYLASLDAQRSGGPVWSLEEFRLWLTLSLLAATGLAAAATVLPMKIGIRHFRRLEV